MRPALLLLILLGTTGFVPSGTIVVRLEGDGKIVTERMVLRGADGNPTYKSPGGDAKITGTISVANELPVPVTALRVRLQLRTKAGAAPRAGGAVVNTPPSSYVDYKLKQPLAPGDTIKLPLSAKLYVTYQARGGYANPFMPSDEQLAQAKTAYLDIEEATIGAREVELTPAAPPPPPPPSQYDSYFNRLDREFTATLARPVTVTATLVVRRNESTALQNDADRPLQPAPLVYRLLVKRDIPVLMKNTGTTGVRNITIAVEDPHRWYTTSLSQHQTIPKPALAPGEEREVAVKLDHVYKLDNETVPPSLPLPLAGRSAYRTVAPRR